MSKKSWQKLIGFLFLGLTCCGLIICVLGLLFPSVSGPIVGGFAIFGYSTVNSLLDDTEFGDSLLIKEYFSTDLSVYPEIEILERIGSASDGTVGGRRLSLRVIIDGYPEPMECLGELYYIRGGGYVLDVNWQDKNCAEREWAVRAAEYYLDKDNTVSPLPEKSEIVAEVLKYWVEENRITLSDIQHHQMRDKVKQLLVTK